MPRQSAPRLEAASREASPNTPFGISRSPSQRVELVFALRNGGVLAVTHDLGTPVTAESLERFCTELRQSLGGAGDWREFGDAWAGTGQRSYVQLSEVIGFTARPAR
ncbi:MAG TPA: hypothetical protein VK066_23255 [Chloroflexota bacterium]|nr:hypothetical protein [Chloroflexota bacterium]